MLFYQLDGMSGKELASVVVVITRTLVYDGSGCGGSSCGGSGGRGDEGRDIIQASRIAVV